MPPLPGAPPPERQELFRVEDRLSFVYVEHCTVHRDANALTFTDQSGVFHVPAAALAALLLGPGTRVTHAAISLIGDCGVSAVWVGEKGVRYYAHGRPLAKTAHLVEAQARIVSNRRARLHCARMMYGMRFPGEDTSSLSMDQLRGREGVRMRRAYRAEAERTGIPWKGRSYDMEDFDTGDDLNRTLAGANAALYGITHAVVCALGCSPALGVVHTGTDRAFVYDIADLYKTDISIPAAFDVVASGVAEPWQEVRRRIRDMVVPAQLLRRITKDIQLLLQVDEADVLLADLLLWNDRTLVSSGRNWGL